MKSGRMELIKKKGEIINENINTKAGSFYRFLW